MSGYVGVTIDGVDTYSRWGLILCNDLVVGTAKVRQTRITVPGLSGTLNYSYALTGEPEYDDRPITFTLAKPVDSASLEIVRQELCALCHGRVKNLILPIDSTHYFKGTFEIGDIGGYNSARIPVSVTADPWKYKNAATSVSKTIRTSGSVTLTNEHKPVSPKVSVSARMTLTWGGKSATLSAGNNQTVDGLVLPAGSTTINVSGSGTITFEYQEASL